MTTTLSNSLKGAHADLMAKHLKRYRELLVSGGTVADKIEEMSELMRVLNKSPDDVEKDQNVLRQASTLQSVIDNGREMGRELASAGTAVAQSMEKTRAAVAALWEKHRQLVEHHVSVHGHVQNANSANGDLQDLKRWHPHLFD